MKVGKALQYLKIKNLKPRKSLLFLSLLKANPMAKPLQKVANSPQLVVGKTLWVHKRYSNTWCHLCQKSNKNFIEI